MKFPKILKSKRGVALENTVLFIIVVFSLCALLTSLTLIGHRQAKLENVKLLQDIQIDQIGEDFVASLGEQTEFDEVYEEYAYEVSGNALTVWRSADEQKTAVLYVEAELVDGQVSVKRWTYGIFTIH